MTEDKEKDMLITIMTQQMTAAQNQIIHMSEELNRVHELLMKSHELLAKVLYRDSGTRIPGDPA